MCLIYNSKVDRNLRQDDPIVTYKIVQKVGVNRYKSLYWFQEFSQSRLVSNRVFRHFNVSEDGDEFKAAENNIIYNKGIHTYVIETQAVNTARRLAARRRYNLVVVQVTAKISNLVAGGYHDGLHHKSAVFMEVEIGRELLDIDSVEYFQRSIW